MANDDLAQRIQQTKHVRYIKLGEGGCEFQDCLENDRLYLGFWSGQPDMFSAIMIARKTNDWRDVERLIELRTQDRKQGFRTLSLNNTKKFFTGDADVLWITFHNRCLYWCLMAPNSFFNTEQYPDNRGPKAHAQTLCGWQNTSISGERNLSVNQLAGFLTKTAGTRQTIVDIKDGKGSPAQYIRNRLCGIEDPDIKRAKKTQMALKQRISTLILRLTPNDFETLVDLIFNRSGWRREGEAGGTQDIVDFELLLPTTGEKAMVQVKSQASWETFKSPYLASFLQDDGGWDKMFWTQHSGRPELIEANLHAIELGDTIEWTDHNGDEAQKLVVTETEYQRIEKIKIMGPDQLAEGTMEAGLLDWLLRRVGG